MSEQKQKLKWESRHVRRRELQLCLDTHGKPALRDKSGNRALIYAAEMSVYDEKNNSEHTLIITTDE